MKIKLKDILKESRIISEGRKEDARERYPNIPEEVFEKFVSLDPSGNHKYLMWVASKWESRFGASRRYYYNDTERAETWMDDVVYFHNNTHKYDRKDINQYNSYSSLNSATQDARIKLTKGELKRQSRKLYETDTFLIIEPMSHASSCFYGSGTRWCTTMRDYDSYYNNYVKTNTLFYFINKKNGKKRAFLTQLGRPMFGGSVIVPNYESHRGTIYTEQDNVGRSMRGIPIEGRAAMAKRHMEKSIEKDPGLQTKLRFGQKVLTRIIRGNLSLSSDMGVTQPPNSFKKVEGNMTLGGGITTVNRIKEVSGNVTLGDSITSTGDLETVGGDLKVGYSLTSLGNIKTIGGDLLRNRGYGNVSLTDLGELKSIGGIFDWRGFPDISLEELQALDSVDEVRISSEKFEELSASVRFPNLPNTPIEIVG
jgi:hypothetical protein